MTLHIFNPSHDEALAKHHPQFVPSRYLRLLGDRHYDLPRWWMSANDSLLRLPSEGKLTDVQSPPWASVERIAPWGWNLTLRHTLAKLGAPQHLLPSVESLDHLRQLSSRRNCSRLIAQLNAFPRHQLVLQPMSHFVTTMDEAVGAIAACGGRAMVKRPWSSSGRGVFPLTAGFSLAERQRVERCLREQGGVEIQRLETRLVDAALEFVVRGDAGVCFEGVSLFLTQRGGSYQGNIVASQAQLRRLLFEQWQRGFAAWRKGLAAAPCCASEHGVSFPCASFADFERLLDEVCRRLRSVLTALLVPDYEGAVGVDILFTPEGVHPCVEINLRHTMGHVAIAIWRRQADSVARLLHVKADGQLFAPMPPMAVGDFDNLV